MAFQIIFVVEADEQSRSDYMYIRAVLDKYYNALTRKDIKFGFFNGYCELSTI